MGRFGSPQIGYHAEEDENDIPELNKCPSCGAFFEGDICPVCKTVCPEEMKAGNRVIPKKKRNGTKRKQVGYRVPPVWYLRTWFILLMLFVSRFIGIILVWMSDWKRWVKITVTVLALGGSYIFGYIVVPLADHFLYPPVEYVNFDISESEYREECEEFTYEELMRDPNAYEDRYMTLTLTVKDVRYLDGYEIAFTGDVILAVDSEGREYVLYDCRADGKNLLAGDVVTVFGQFARAGNEYVFDAYAKYPVLYVAYADIKS